MNPKIDRTRTEFIYRYVLHERVPAYEKLGWIRLGVLDGTHHGEYSAYMEWPFDGRDPVEPEGEKK